MYVNSENNSIDTSSTVIRPHNEPIYTAPIDLSHKLFLISQVCKKDKNKVRPNGAAISASILIDSGIYIEPNECESLIREYRFLLKPNNGYAVFAVSVILILCLLYFNREHVFINSLFSLLLLPFIINFFNEVIIFSKLFSFNPKKLMPSVVMQSEMLGSTAIIIASRNEPFDVAKMTFDSALALVYPSGKKEIIVVDNSNTSFSDYENWKNYVESFAEGSPCHVDGVRVVFIHRDGTEGFKPRNLDIALEEVTSEFILYLDVDSTVLEDTLLRVTPIFLRDKNLGFVQLYTTPTNAKGKSALALTQGLRNYFLRLETVFYTHTSHSLFYGHNAIWRTKTVREIGSCLEYYKDEVVVTEDLSMSFRARFNGYYGVGAWLESGEWVPESMRETEAMWLRWTVGTYQVYAKHFTKLENLKKFSRAELFGWLQHVGVLINYGLLPLYAVLGLVFNSTLLMSMVAFSLLPEVIQAINAYFKLSLGGMSPLKKIFKCYSAFLTLGSFINWVRCIGLFRYLAGKKQGWTPTGKSCENEISLMDALWSRYSFLLFGVGCFSYSLFSMVYLTKDLVDIILVAVCGVYGLNSIAAVFSFGVSRMQEDTATAAKHGRIHDYINFYMDKN